MAVNGVVASKDNKRGIDTNKYGFLPLKKMPGHYVDGDSITVSEDALDVDAKTLAAIQMDLAIQDGRAKHEAAKPEEKIA